MQSYTKEIYIYKYMQICLLFFYILLYIYRGLLLINSNFNLIRKLQKKNIVIIIYIKSCEFILLFLIVIFDFTDGTKCYKLNHNSFLLFKINELKI